MAQLNTFKSFIDKVLEHVPEDKKESVRAEYSRAQDEATSLEEARANVIRTAEAQTVWWGQHKGTVEELKKLKEAGGNQITDAVDKDTLGKGLQGLEDKVMSTGLALMTTMTQLGLDHMSEFPGEKLDVTKLANEAMKAGKPLVEYYNEQVAPKRTARQEAEIAKKVADATEAGRKLGVEETLKKVPGQGMPYPVGTSSPTTLAGLKKPAEGQSDPYSLDAAVATANAEMVKGAGT